MEERGSGVTYVLVQDGADVAHVHDPALMPDHAHSDGVLAHLRRHIAFHLEAQVTQHH